MSAFYDGLQSTASRLLKKFGKSITVQVLTGSTYDPATLGNISTFSDSTGFGVTVPIKSSEVDGSLILTGDVKLIIENISLAPVVGSMVVNNSITYRVEMSEPLNPADTNLIYTCMLRK